MPSITGWNKARVKRLLEDHRYTGTDGYPAIIDEASYQAVQSLKASRNSQVNIDRKADIYQLDVPVRCPVCGARMKRRSDGRSKGQQHWNCQTAGCMVQINKSDASLLSDLTELLNLIISDTDVVVTRPEKADVGSARRKTENEIGRLMDSARFDKDELRKKLYERFTLAYKDIDSNTYMDARMKADFEKSDPLSNFSVTLFNRTVSEILIHTDGTVAIMLINHQIIQKEPNA